MDERDDFSRKAREARRLAALARRLLARGGVSAADDVGGLTAFAEELEAKAADLEAQGLAGDLSVPPVSPVVTRPQQQAQQQQQSDDATPADDPAGRAPPKACDTTH